MGNNCDENLRIVYQEISRRVQKIDDFRAKILGFLPLASGTGLFLLFGRHFGDQNFRSFIEPYYFPVGWFGFFVTLGLFLYELRGIQRCDSLQQHGCEIEKKFGIEGQFNPKLPPKFWIVRATTAAYVIYPTVFGVWLFLLILGYRSYDCRNLSTKTISFISFGLPLVLSVIFIIFDTIKDNKNSSCK